jgi:lysine/ornithine N-monooxygenase
MVGNPLPRLKSQAPFWQTAASDLKDFRSTQNLPTESDIVIIGGGYSAASLVTHTLNEATPPPSIVVLEARQLCSGATGRNGE